MHNTVYKHGYKDQRTIDQGSSNNSNVYISPRLISQQSQNYEPSQQKYPTKSPQHHKNVPQRKNPQNQLINTFGKQNNYQKMIHKSQNSMQIHTPSHSYHHKNNLNTPNSQYQNQQKSKQQIINKKMEFNNLCRNLYQDNPEFQNIQHESGNTEEKIKLHTNDIAINDSLAVDDYQLRKEFGDFRENLKEGKAKESRIQNYQSDQLFYLSPSQHMVEDIYNILYTPYSRDNQHQRKTSFANTDLFLKDSLPISQFTHKKQKGQATLQHSSTANINKQLLKNRFRETLQEPKIDYFNQSKKTDNISHDHHKNNNKINNPTHSQYNKKHSKPSNTSNPQQHQHLDIQYQESYLNDDPYIHTKQTSQNSQITPKPLQLHHQLQRELFYKQKIEYLTKFNEQLMRQNINLKTLLKYERETKQKLNILKMNQIKEMAINMVKRLENVEHQSQPNMDKQQENEVLAKQRKRSSVGYPPLDHTGKNSGKSMNRQQKLNNPIPKKQQYLTINFKNNKQSLPNRSNPNICTYANNQNTHKHLSNDSSKDKNINNSRKDRKKKMNSEQKQKSTNYDHLSRFYQQKRFETSDQALTPASPRQNHRENNFYRLLGSLNSQKTNSNQKLAKIKSSLSPPIISNSILHRQSPTPPKNITIPNSYRNIPKFLKKRISQDGLLMINQPDNISFKNYNKNSSESGQQSIRYNNYIKSNMLSYGNLPVANIHHPHENLQKNHKKISIHKSTSTPQHYISFNNSRTTTNNNLHNNNTSNNNNKFLNNRS